MEFSPFSQVGLDDSYFSSPSSIPEDAFQNMEVPKSPWESFMGGLSSFWEGLGAGGKAHRGMDRLPEEAAAPSGGSFWEALGEGSKHHPR
jgi:hypothetical protein